MLETRLTQHSRQLIEIEPIDMLARPFQVVLQSRLAPVKKLFLRHAREVLFKFLFVQRRSRMSQRVPERPPTN